MKVLDKEALLTRFEHCLNFEISGFYEENAFTEVQATAHQKGLVA